MTTRDRLESLLTTLSNEELCRAALVCAVAASTASASVSITSLMREIDVGGNAARVRDAALLALMLCEEEYEQRHLLAQSDAEYYAEASSLLLDAGDDHTLVLWCSEAWQW